MKITKPNSLIFCTHDLSLIEQRMVNLLIYAFQTSEHELGDDSGIFRIVDYTQLYGMERSTAFKGLRDAISDLNHKSYKPIQGNPQSYFEYIEYKQGKVSFKFSDQIIHELKSKNGISIELMLTPELKSKYALHLYEVFKAYEQLKQNYMSFSKNDFRNLIGLQVNEYLVWSNLKARVLDESLKMINSSTDLMVDYKLHRTNRKISDISFTFVRKVSHFNI
ncbi:TPA: replication initiation protein [Acinetobacter baumannii]|uniref:replication initiation protein n=1 Tax=Acinetobacter baumannii TaxID=470 RepID=UPI00338E727D